MSSQQDKDVEKAYQAALAVRQNAHAPYSRFRVGAAIVLDGVRDPVVGCNMENANFSGSICAERLAMGQAVARWGKARPRFLVIATDDDKPTPPCGDCRQVLAEFCADDFVVYLANPKGIQCKFKLGELLPHAFRSFRPEAP